MRKLVLSTIMGLALAMSASAATVTTELLLLVDVSGSISTAQFNLQRTGYANAFANPTIQGLIASNTGGVAVRLVYWSGSAQQGGGVAWTQLQNAADANAFSLLIGASTRPYSGSTAVQDALEFGRGLFVNNGFEGARKIIDISGDGADNNSVLLAGVGRNNALADGIVINGLVIGGNASVLNYYTNNVIGGPGSFVATAETFDDVGATLERKIFRELGGDIPEPSTYLMLGSGFLALGIAKARKRK